MSNANDDILYMRKALSLAREALGTTAPNPSVGCVIVNNGTLISQGVTQKGGRPHAEVVALQHAGDSAKEATAYVTLEPCCHTGQTGPCTEALINAKIARVVIATPDPFSKVCGKGIKALQKAGIKVDTGICEEEAQNINQGFFNVCTKQRPFVTLKLATSVDGKIATQTGQSQWITSQKARDYGHALRAQHDAIMVGSGTALADDPLLNCRLEGYGDRTPIRIVVSSQQALPASSKLVQTASADTPVWLVTCATNPKPYENKHVSIVPCPTNAQSRVNLDKAMALLAKQGVTRLLVEGGSTLARSLVKDRLVDELVWIKAPMLIGHGGLDAIGDLGVESLNDAVKLSLKSTQRIGDDTVEIYKLL